ncbi:MAG: helix-turn-helix transcriptional regulator [Anaerolineales bacterium]|jgi:PadR family transcriptional regulator AphA
MRASDISPEYPLLGFLAQSPAHGYELHKRLDEDLTGIWNLSQSQVYNILKRLENQGDINSEIKPGKSAPDKYLLSITKIGAQRFRRWLDEPTPGSVRAVRVEFLTRLFFARRMQKEYALGLIKNQQRALKKDINRLQKDFNNIPQSLTLNRLSFQLRLRQLQSCIDWIEDIRNQLE